MTDTEAAEIWDALSAMLKQSGLEGLLREVEDYLVQGKPEEREVEVFEEQSSGEQHLFPVQDWRRRPGPRSRYLATVDYTGQERVYILAQAILHAIVFSRQMEHDIWGYLEKASGNSNDLIIISSINVVHENQNKEPSAWSLQRQIPVAELSSLQHLLEQISKAAQE